MAKFKNFLMESPICKLKSVLILGGIKLKKVLYIVFILLLLTGCSSSGSSSTSGKVTDLSKKYLSKGYIVNVYRTVTPLSDSVEDMGKGNVSMVFLILVDHYSTIDYNNKDLYIKKQIVSNIKITKSSKMGTVGDIYANYQSYSAPDFKIVGTNNTYEKTYDQPIAYGAQNSIAVELDNIAFVDSSKYPDSITLSQLYSALGITRDSVALTVSFRIELVTVGNKTFYKDYVIEVPPASYNISGSEFRTDFITEDVNKMEPYLEK